MSVLVYAAIKNNQINFVSIFYPPSCSLYDSTLLRWEAVDTETKKKVNILSSKVYNQDLQSSNSLLVAFIQFN